MESTIVSSFALLVSCDFQVRRYRPGVQGPDEEHLLLPDGSHILFAGAVVLERWDSACVGV